MLKVGRTFNLDSKIINGIETIQLDFPAKHKFIGVYLYFDEEPEIYLFSSVEDLFNHGQNKDNYYCFLECDQNIIYILEKIDKELVIGGKNVYCKSGDWKLFINTKTNIVIQQTAPNTHNTYFRNFPSNQSFYISLSYLYYTLRNYRFDLNSTVKSKFDLLNKY